MRFTPPSPGRWRTRDVELGIGKAKRPCAVRPDPGTGRHPSGLETLDARPTKPEAARCWNKQPINSPGAYPPFRVDSWRISRNAVPRISSLHAGMGREWVGHGRTGDPSHLPSPWGDVKNYRCRPAMRTCMKENSSTWVLLDGRFLGRAAPHCGMGVFGQLAMQTSVMRLGQRCLLVANWVISREWR
jgi:hypothetical protein